VERVSRKRVVVASVRVQLVHVLGADDLAADALLGMVSSIQLYHDVVTRQCS
jgi:hypothetical protein